MFKAFSKKTFPRIINFDAKKLFSTSNVEKITNSLNLAKLNSKLNTLELTLKGLSSIIFFPFGITSIKQNWIRTYYIFGKYDGYRTNELKWIPPIAEVHDVFCGDITLNHTGMHLTDLVGNPIIVNTFVIYNVINPVNHKINLLNDDVLHNWTENIIRGVISSYSYEDLTHNSVKEKISLDLLEKINGDTKADFYGISIQRAGLLQINYSQEIAETMLVKQKAKATIEARKELIDATLNLVNDIGSKLDTKLTQEDKSKLTMCLTISMIGSNNPSQVINLN